jgi:hypothetical protein
MGMDECPDLAWEKEEGGGDRINHYLVSREGWMDVMDGWIMHGQVKRVDLIKSSFASCVCICLSVCLRRNVQLKSLLLLLLLLLAACFTCTHIRNESAHRASKRVSPQSD